MSRTLTHATALDLGDLLKWVHDGAKVRYSLDGGDTIWEGILRHVVAGKEPSQWGFPSGKAEIRDQYIRITGAFGGRGPSEIALPIEQILDLMAEGLFVAEKKKLD